MKVSDAIERFQIVVCRVDEIRGFSVGEGKSGHCQRVLDHLQSDLRAAGCLCLCPENFGQHGCAEPHACKICHESSSSVFFSSHHKVLQKQKSPRPQNRIEDVLVARTAL